AGRSRRRIRRAATRAFPQAGDESHRSGQRDPAWLAGSIRSEPAAGLRDLSRSIRAYFPRGLRIGARGVSGSSGRWVAPWGQSFFAGNPPPHEARGASIQNRTVSECPISAHFFLDLIDILG